LQLTIESGTARTPNRAVAHARKPQKTGPGRESPRFGTSGSLTARAEARYPVQPD
jgi:hypothetical protein